MCELEKQLRLMDRKLTAILERYWNVSSTTFMKTMKCWTT